MDPGAGRCVELKYILYALRSKRGDVDEGERREARGGGALKTRVVVAYSRALDG
jgi:hypothetical protein